MTFSFRPRNKSLRPAKAASVSTRVVSWKEAADMKDSVEDAALAIPNNNGSAVAGRAPLWTASSFCSSNVHFSTCAAGKKLSVSWIFNSNPAKHLFYNDFDVFVIDIHLATCKRLNFRNKITSRVLFT